MVKHPQTEYSGTELDALASAVNYHRWIVDLFRPYLGATAVEVGAGIGSVSSLLLEAPIEQLFAFEPANNLYPHLAECLRSDERAVAVHDMFALSSLPNGRGSVDSIVYLNVLEHIEADRAELLQAFESLKPGGHLLVFVPALQWLYSDFDRHVGHHRRYTKQSLSDLAQGVGYRVVHARYFDLVGIVPWYICFVLLRGRPGSAGVGWYDRLVVPIMRRLENRLHPPLGKNVLLIAQRPE